MTPEEAQQMGMLLSEINHRNLQRQNQLTENPVRSLADNRKRIVEDAKRGIGSLRI